ncbi:putative ATP-grasp-modified RiPP [Nonomuraea sp. NPDC049141]|uniref:putative ATP-grasp-modified RiPP n=1 Tax=Nonomuraea sp. NPDC049141 TaxID=3155500 RepID=UPI0033CBBCB6
MSQSPAAPADQSFVPWGVSRMAPFPSQGEGPTPHHRISIDPVTQKGVRLDPVTNRPIEAAGKHGSNVQQATPTAPPTPDGDGSRDGGAKPDSTTDWVSD